VDAVEAWDKLSSRERKKILLVVFVCPEGCRLLNVWNSPSGRMYYQPGHRLRRHTADTETAEEARRAHTLDGYRTWPARGGDFDQLLEFYASAARKAWMTLVCDHIRKHVELREIEAEVERSRPGDAKRRTIST
jgi:hypothetical protein